MDSIIQKERCCYVCGSRGLLHSHHVFMGSKRQLSEKYGLKIWLCPSDHNMSDKGIHFNPPLDARVKKMAQEKAMDHYGWSKEDFIKIFRRNYL